MECSVSSPQLMSPSVMVPTIGNKRRKVEPVEVKEIKCPVCNDIFNGWVNVWGHLINEHKIELGGYKFLCSMCGRKYRRRGDFNTHMKTHTTDAPYRCIICTKKHVTEDELNGHMTSKHPNHKQLYVDCRICGRFTKTVGFKQHFQKHVVKMEEGYKKKPQPCVQILYPPSPSTINKSSSSINLLENASEKLDSSSNESLQMQAVLDEELTIEKSNPNMHDVITNGQAETYSTPSCTAINDSHSEQTSPHSQPTTTSLDYRQVAVLLQSGYYSVHWKYDLMPNELVFVNSADGGRFEWILNRPEFQNDT